MSTAAGNDSPPQIENNHAPRRQERQPFKPRADLVGTYNPYHPGPEAPRHTTDDSVNVDLTQHETKEARKERIDAKRLEAQKARKKYLASLRTDEANNRRDGVPSDMGFLNPGEVGTDEEVPDHDEDDDALDGFQLLKLVDEKIVDRKQTKIDQAIDDGKLGTIEDPAQALITLEENDHLVGQSHEVKDFSDLNKPTLEERFENAKARKLLTKVNIERDGRVYDTNIQTDRISNHRQKDFLKNNGKGHFVREVWDEASFVEVMVRPHGETQVVIHAVAKDGKDGKELRLDVKDFFAMFSVPDVNGGESCFQDKSFRLNNPADEIKLKTFFEKVKVNGKKIGANKEGPPTIIKITPWAPREASKSEKDNLKDMERQPMPWHESNLNGDAHDETIYPQSGNQKPRNSDVNQRDIWKRW